MSKKEREVVEEALGEPRHSDQHYRVRALLEQLQAHPHRGNFAVLSVLTEFGVSKLALADEESLPHMEKAVKAALWDADRCASVPAFTQEVPAECAMPEVMGKEAVTFFFEGKQGSGKSRAISELISFANHFLTRKSYSGLTITNHVQEY